MWDARAGGGRIMHEVPGTRGRGETTGRAVMLIVKVRAGDVGWGLSKGEAGLARRRRMGSREGWSAGGRARRR